MEFFTGLLKQQQRLNPSIDSGQALERLERAVVLN
jgi:hypothetical protein